jgi:hypothetical protein
MTLSTGVMNETSPRECTSVTEGVAACKTEQLKRCVPRAHRLLGHRMRGSWQGRCVATRPASHPQRSHCPTLLLLFHHALLPVALITLSCASLALSTHIAVTRQLTRCTLDCMQAPPGTTLTVSGVRRQHDWPYLVLKLPCV